MGLLDFKNYELVIKPETLAIRNIKFIWDRDKSKTKNKAIRELSFIYFVYDPRSDYTYLTQLEDRQAKVAEELGLGSDFKPDKRLEDAIESYKDSTNTVSSGLLDDTKYTINKIRQFLRETDIDDVDTADKIVRALDKIPNLVKQLIKTQQIVNEEIEENNLMRGQKQKKIMEDGIII